MIHLHNFNVQTVLIDVKKLYRLFQWKGAHKSP